VKTDDYYQLLGVSRFASQDALKRAFRVRLLAVHPDQNPQDEIASERTLKIIEAYKALSNPQTRYQHDALYFKPAEPVTYFAPRRKGILFSVWAFKYFSYACVLAIMAYVVVMLIGGCFADQGLVFRPDLSKIEFGQLNHQTKSYPMIVHPDFSDSMAWYTATEYQLGIANKWAADEMLKSYAQAANHAKQCGDIARADFFRRYIRQANSNHFYCFSGAIKRET